jgi:ATP-dependent DNA helicase RecQ
MLSGFSRISEDQLGRSLKVDRKEVVDMLRHLHELRVLLYQPARDTPQVTFTLPRQDAERLPLDFQRLEARRKLILGKMKAMAAFVTTDRCRMQQIQLYFDEDTDQTCGICDVCVRNRKETNGHAFDNMRDEVLRVLKDKAMSVEQLETQIAPDDHELFVDAVRDLVDDGVLQYDSVWKLGIAKQKR